MAAIGRWCLAATLAVGALVHASEPPEAPAYPLQPVFRKPGDKLSDSTCGSRVLHLDKNREAEMDFATASGKLRFRMLPDKVLIGPHEIGYKFLVDRNGDGTIDGADGEAVAPKEVFTVPVTLGGKPFQYPLSIIQVYSLPLGEHAYCAINVASMVYLEAQLGPPAKLYDSNCNGRFGDIAGSASAGKDDLLEFGLKGEARPVSKCVLLPDGKLHEVQIVGGGEGIRFPPYAGPLATLTVNTKDEWRVRMRLRHTDSGFETDASTGTEVALPPGAYQAKWVNAEWRPKPNDATGAARPAVTFVGLGALGLQLKEGENNLPFGPPFKLDFTAARSTEDDADIEVAEVSLVGAGGERYRPRVFSAGGPKTIGVSIRAGGDEQRVCTLAYG
ncbi:MAG: hypothetical protein NTW87_15470 [Planctomycetota bacterium]|nr:hypothetical protein [Planctomycetota bacterium]